MSSSITRALDLGLSVLVTGGTRADRTALLHGLADEPNGPDSRSGSGSGSVSGSGSGGLEGRYVDASHAGSPVGLLALVAEAYALDNQPSTPDADRETLHRIALLARDFADRRESTAHRDRPGAHQSRPVVLLDEPDPKVALTLFGRLRDELWEIPLTWVVAVDEADAALLTRPPSDAFFALTVDLGHLATIS